MERLAHTDFLTRLANRRYFMQRLTEETERVKRGNQPMSVLLLDMDSFKSVNDTHGHDIGDRVLQVIASVTQEVKRVSDVAARIGGEEFAMLLPDTDREGAIKLAQRLRRTINEQMIADAKASADSGDREHRRCNDVARRSTASTTSSRTPTARSIGQKTRAKTACVPNDATRC